MSFRSVFFFLLVFLNFLLLTVFFSYLLLIIMIIIIIGVTFDAATGSMALVEMLVPLKVHQSDTVMGKK